MNVDEWKEKQLKTIEESYALLKVFNPELLPNSNLWDIITVTFSADTFPYDEATEIRAQAVGNGERGLFDLRFYYWKGLLHAYISFSIGTDADLEKVLQILSKLKPATKANIASVVTEELKTELIKPRWAKDETKADAKYRLAEPKVAAEIQRINKILKELK